MNRFLLALMGILFLVGGSCAPAHATAGPSPHEPIVGLPCEGCEAVFDGLPAVLAPRGRYAYHTDSHGVHPSGGTATSEAARLHGRLRGWVKTDEEGRYRFDTMRPASYPDAKTPAHVHMYVSEIDRCTYYIDSIHFADDPGLSPEKREQLAEGRGGSGLVRPRREPDGTWVVTRDIRLGEGVPGYPMTAAATLQPAECSYAKPVEQSDLDDRFLVTEPEWSRDGRYIAFAGGIWPDLDILVLDKASREFGRVFRSEATDYMPSWSPDGERIVFASTRAGTHDLYVGSATGGQVDRITTNDNCDDTEPRWSPDGKWIAFRSDCDGNREVYRIRPDGSNRQRLTHDDAEDGEPSWAPDSQRIVFTSSRDGQPEVYKMALDGTDPVRQTTTAGGHSRRAEWSPDGAWIAFGSNREGNEELYIMRADGSAVSNVSRHPAREYYSRWSPDGGHLLFTSNRGRDKNAIYMMRFDGTAVEQLFPVPRGGDDGAQSLAAYVASQFCDDEPGGVVLIARGEQPLLRAAYGLADVAAMRPMEIDQPLPIGSVTKSFTAAAILALVAKGEVALGDDVRKHDPEVPVGEQVVTIEQLLTHTSGMPNLVDVPGFPEWAAAPRSSTELLALTEAVPFHFEPGTGFAYSDSGYILLGAVLEHHHPGTWADAVRDLVVRPLRLASVASAELVGERLPNGYEYDGSAFVVARAIDWSVPHASGALVATADDLLAWVHAWRDGTVATRELSERAWAGRRLPDGTRSGYGFGWKRCDFEGRTAIQHGGRVPGFTASVLHLPDDDLTAIALLNSTDKVEASYLTRRVLRLLLTGSPDLSLHPLTSDQRTRLAGRYRTASGAIWTVREKEDDLVLDLAGRRVALAALSETSLCAVDSDGTWCFTFELDGTGRASSVAVSLTCEPQGKAWRVE